ncbi:hypothetical protein HYN69_14865 [Gemmobacter aquarius]|uniref:Uncharacterized protein n=1 Tax=Paragemmobacter aquarius TaxID=2169400 RepID=A0A2S0UP55_9RHOB|nr:hypothetical protein [Gemmobacter aquarius]AWB49608.1 hypothetical protein HYN69_14865 [Gemmobacter aquarius]
MIRHLFGASPAEDMPSARSHDRQRRAPGLVQMIEDHDLASDRLLGHLATPNMATGCVTPLFTREIGGAQQGPAPVEAVAQLNGLPLRGSAGRRLSETGALPWLGERW